MGRVLEEVILQELSLTGTGLILAGFQGYHVVERSHLHSCQNSSRQHWMRISRVTNQGLQVRVITKVGRIPIVGRITVRDGRGCRTMLQCKETVKDNVDVTSWALGPSYVICGT